MVMPKRGIAKRIVVSNRKKKGPPPAILSPEYYKVFEGNFADAYEKEYPLVIYERGPHKKTIPIAGVSQLNTRFNLHFPYIVFIYYKKTLFAALSKHSFVSLDYVGYCSVPFNHFEYYVCLPYEYNEKTVEAFINQFYTLMNRAGNVKAGLIKRWAKFSEEGFSPTHFDWSCNKKYGPVSIREMIYPTSYTIHPHQHGNEYDEYYPPFKLNMTKAEAAAYQIVKNNALNRVHQFVIKTKDDRKIKKLKKK
jgi:hypothetical protein